MNARTYITPPRVTLGLVVISLVFAVAWELHNVPAEARVQAASTTTVLIDDFSQTNHKSALGTQWVLPTEKSSTGKVEFTKDANDTVLHLTGPIETTLEARLSLNPKGRNFSAKTFEGLQLRVKGNGQSYAVRLRTKDTRYAKQYYEGKFQAESQWKDVQVPFARFTPVGTLLPLNPSGLRAVAVVAANEKAEADLYVDRIAFYHGGQMFNELTPAEERVILYKGTEAPFTGKYTNYFEKGVYTCKRCGAELYESSSKFHSSCGWPSFDDQIEGAVKWQRDADGVRTEIICANCGGHLGHVFQGEGFTTKNTRHCVNSISMNFIPADQRGKEKKMEKAIFASGCFWGTEYHMQRASGVISTTVGYTGGHVDNPTYKQVCTDKTGHAEAVEIVYDPAKTDYEKLAKLFFETHDFTQLNRQGPDIGKQYRSAIFYLNDEQKQTAEKLVGILKEKGYKVKTEITPADTFWPAEDYHQDYYNKTQKTPYCHIYRPIF